MAVSPELNPSQDTFFVDSLQKSKSFPYPGH